MNLRDFAPSIYMYRSLTCLRNAVQGLCLLTLLSFTIYWASEGKHGITPHELSPHPHVITSTLFISPMDCTVFMALHCHLGDH